MPQVSAAAHSHAATSLDAADLRAVFESPQPAVVIFPVSHAVAFSVIRALECTGVPILAVDFKPQAAGLFSRRVASVYLPDMYADEEVFFQTLMDIGKRFRERPVLFCVDDEDLFLSLKRRQEIEVAYRLPLSDWEVVHEMVDKGRLYRKLQGEGLPCPVTWFPRDAGSLQDMQSELQFPCILKPTFSTRFREMFGIKAKRFEDFESLNGFAAEVDAAGIGYVVQEFIPGPADELFTFAAYTDANGRVIGAMTGKKVHQFPPDFGTCRLGVTLLMPELEEIGCRMLSALGYQGISLAEFKRTPDGEFKLIEINTRPGDWPERLAQLCGSNLVEMAYRDAVGDSLQVVDQRRAGLKWANLAEDFYYCIRGYRRLGYEYAHRGFLGWLKDIKGLRTGAFFSWTDPMPAWIRFKGMLREFLARERSLSRGKEG